MHRYSCHRALLLLLLAGILSACALPQALATLEIPSPTAPIPSTLTPFSLPTVATLVPASPIPSTPLPLSSPTPTSSTTQYFLQAEFDYYAYTLSVLETIRYTNQTGVALPDLLLVVRPLDWAGSFQLTTLTWEDGTPITDAKTDAALLRIPLPQPLVPGGQVGLQLNYTLRLPEILSSELGSRPLPYGYTERQANLVDWYPYLPPYRPGEGWLAHAPAATGEHLVYALADFQVQVALAEPVPGLVIAASAPATQDGLTYSFSLPAARAFAWSASPYYQVLSQAVGEATVSSYFFPYNAAAGQAVLDATVQALSLYNELLGPYSRPSLSAVEADFPDGMEYSGLYFISRAFYDWYDGTPRGYLTTIAAHETAHQWWFEQVGSDQALEPWLDEALCTYMESLYYESLDAQNPSQDEQPLVDWWWYFRVELYAPAGPLNGTIYDFSSFRSYRDAVYLRGAQFIEALRQQMGDEAFFAFLRTYASEMSGEQATAADFFRILEAYAGEVSGLREEYFSP
jgi:hypothetical protein